MEKQPSKEDDKDHDEDDGQPSEKEDVEASNEMAMDFEMSTCSKTESDRSDSAAKKLKCKRRKPEDKLADDLSDYYKPLNKYNRLKK